VVRVTLNCPLAVLLALGDRPGTARECLTEAGRLARELGYAEEEVVIPIFAAAVESAAGRLVHALGHLDRAATAARRVAAGQLGAIMRESARLLLELGQPAVAADRLAVLDTTAALPRSDRADLDGLGARLAAGRGAALEARTLAAAAVRAAAGTDSPLVRALAALDHAQTLWLLGHPALAVTFADRARQRFEAKGYHAGADRVRKLISSMRSG
jgi:hypothetical protein